ncbi:MAG: helical backbone metal receptor [Pyrinomonadaceae bacterium]
MTERFLKTGVFVLAMLLASAAFGCYRPSEPAVEVKTRSFTDDLGRKVRLPEKIDSVISLAPNLTEIIFAVGGGERLVGVTTFCNYPQGAASIRKVSDTLTPNIESIVALRPQVVFVSTSSQLEAFAKVLSDQKIVVFVTAPNGLDDIYKSIGVIGEILGTSDRAEAVIREMRGRVELVELGVSDRNSGKERPKVFVQIDKNSLYTIGRESFITDIITRAGGVSATAELATAYPKLSKETALVLNPDVIILSVSDDNREANEVFRNSPAVKNGRVYRVSADLLSRPGPRIVAALELIAANLAVGPSKIVTPK